MRNTKIRGNQIIDAFAGDGLAKDASENLKINLETSNPGLAIATDKLDVKIKADAGLETNADGMLVDVTDVIDTNYGITEDTNKIRVNITADKGLHFNAGALEIELDGTTLAVSATGIKVKDAGITETQLNATVAGTGLVGGAGSALSVDLDEVTEVVMTVADDYVVFLDASDSGDTKKDKFADVVALMAGTGLSASGGQLSVDTIVDNIVEADIQMENLSGDINDSGYAGEHTLSNTPIANSVQVYLNGLIQEEGSGKDYTLTGAVIQFATQPIDGEIVQAHYIINN